MVVYGHTMLREHNCYPQEFRLLWDYMKHFKVVEKEDGTIARYYSESAFATDDSVLIQK